MPGSVQMKKMLLRLKSTIKFLSHYLSYGRWNIRGLISGLNDNVSFILETSTNIYVISVLQLLKLTDLKSTMRISQFGRKGKSPHISVCVHTMLKGIKKKI